MAGLTRVTSPTKPSVGVARLGRDEPGVLAAQSPTASGPCTLMADTMSRLTLPDEHHAGDVERSRRR